DGEEAVQTRARVLDALVHLGSRSAAEISEVAQELAKGTLELALTVSLAFYREALEVALGAEPAAPRTADGIPSLRLTEAARLRHLDAVWDPVDAVAQNANRVLAPETMFLARGGIERGEAGRRA